MADNSCRNLSLTQNTVSNIFLLVERAFKEMDTIQRRNLAELGLTSAQYSILNQLWEKDQLPFKELAERSCCSRPTVTGIIDTLEKKDLVKRSQSQEDRRSFLVELTLKGQKLNFNAPKLDNMFIGCCSSMNSEDLLKLEQLLKDFLQVLEFSL